MSELRALELNRILSDASLFAGKDSALPMLNQVKLEATGTDLIAVATDRFMVGVSRTPFVSEPWEMGLRMEHVEMLRYLTRKGRGRPVIVEVAPTPKLAKLNVTQVVEDGTTVGVPAFRSAEFPAWRQLMKEPGPDESLGYIAFNPAYLARFAKVRSNARGQQMQMSFTKPSRPCQVKIGDDFIGLIMPVRLPEGCDASIPEWLQKKELVSA